MTLQAKNRVWGIHSSIAMADVEMKVDKPCKND